MAVRAVEWLRKNASLSESSEWFWNPRQTGDDKEPDVRVTVESAVVVSAEASASENPKGSIDKHMAKTLKKLSKMEGRLYYFIRTETMAKRAKTKIEKANWPITVVTL